MSRDVTDDESDFLRAGPLRHTTMILMPPKIVLEQHLRPAGLPEELINELTPCGYQGPGKTNPWYWQPDVERFVRDRRPKSLDKKSYGEEEGLKVIAAADNDVWERIATSLEKLVTVVVPKEATPPVLEMLSPAEAAKQMKRNVQTVREWCRDGRLGIKSGSTWLISPDEVKQYLRGQLLIKGKVA